jgi:hypothetical protein
MGGKFHVKPGPPAWPNIWAITEWFYWPEAINDILRQDTDWALFKAAYESVDWKRHYKRLKRTPFYRWAKRGGGILSFGGPAHIKQNRFFSTIGDMSTREEDWLEKHPEFNQILHDIHVEVAEQMIDFLLHNSPDNEEKD